MIFNNCGKSLNKCLFRYGADELENPKSYKYLCLIMSWSLWKLKSLYTRVEERCTQCKTLYKLWKEMGNHFRENIKLMMKLFDALRCLPYSFMRVKCGGLIAMDSWKRIQQNKFKINSWSGRWDLINTAIIIMHAGLRHEGFQWELKPNVGTLCSG